MTPPSGHRVERRPSWLALVAVAVLAAVGGAVLAGGRGSDPPSAPASTSTPPTVGIDLTDDPPPATTVPPSPLLTGSETKLLMAEGDRFSVVDLGTGVTNMVPLPLSGFTEHQPVVVGDRIVIEQRFVAYSIDRRFSTPLVELGPATAVVPAGGDEVWLVDYRSDTAVRVAADGSERGRPIALPDGSWAISEAAGGLVLSSPRQWRRYTRDGTLVREQDGAALAGDDDTIVWRELGCRSPCDLHVTDVTTGADRSVSLSADPLVTLYDAALSPDGRWLAVGGDLAPGEAYEVVVIDLVADPPAVAVAADGLTTPPGVMSWSPDSRWMFWTRRTFGTNESSLTAFDVTRSSTVDLDVGIRSIVTFVAY